MTTNYQSSNSMVMVRHRAPPLGFAQAIVDIVVFGLQGYAVSMTSVVKFAKQNVCAQAQTTIV